MGAARTPGPLSQVDRPVDMSSGVSSLNAAAVPGPAVNGQPLSGSAPMQVQAKLLWLNAGQQGVPKGAKTPPNTSIWAAWSGPLPVIVRAVLGVGANPPLTWEGDGREVPELFDNTYRYVDISYPGKYTVTCTDGGSLFTAIIYALSASMTGFQGNNGRFSQDNIPTITRLGGLRFNTRGGKTGRWMRPGTTLQYSDFCETQYTILPSVFIADGNAELFDTSKVQFQITRQKQAKAFVGASSSNLWVQKANDPDFLADPDASNCMLNPFGANGHIYCNDGPGVIMNEPMPAGLDRWVMKLHLKQLVRVTFDGLPAEGMRCSEEFWWHDFASLELVNGQWTNVNTFGGNELMQGDKPLDPTPTPIAPSTPP